MAASADRIDANRRNAAKSMQPNAAGGADVSRPNSLKDGPKVTGIVFTIDDAAEIERRFASFRSELQPSGEVGLTLVSRAATLAVRMEKCSERELKAAAERMTRAMAEVAIPNGVDAAEATRIRTEAGRLAALDTSKEGRLARSYEAAAERGFFRALRELRLVEKQAKATAEAGDPSRDVERFRKELASILEMRKLDDEFDAAYPDMGFAGSRSWQDPAIKAELARIIDGVDVPLTIGRGR